MEKLTKQEMADELRKSWNRLDEWARCPSNETVDAIFHHLQLVTLALATHMETDHEN